MDRFTVQGQVPGVHSFIPPKYISQILVKLAYNDHQMRLHPNCAQG